MTTVLEVRKTGLQLPVNFNSAERDLVRDVPREAKKLLSDYDYHREAQELVNEVSRYIRKAGQEYVRWATVFTIVDHYIELVPLGGSEYTYFDLLDFLGRDDIPYPQAFHEDGDYGYMKLPGWRPWTNIILNGLPLNPSIVDIAVRVRAQLLEGGHNSLAKHFMTELRRYRDARGSEMSIIEFLKITNHFVRLFPAQRRA